MAFNFQTQLAVGKNNEALFKSKFPNLNKLDGKGPDFELNGMFIELKTDTYDPSKTGNFFMEQFSDKARQSPGGPWQAKGKGSVVFCYHFIKTGELYVFNTSKLVEHLDLHVSEYRNIDVRNRTWITLGLLVPISSLESLFKKYKIEDDLDEEIFKVGE